MSLGRREIDQRPGSYVSGARARRLVQAGHARITAQGKLRFFNSYWANGEPRAHWSAYSRVDVALAVHELSLSGFRMNGALVNRAIEHL